MSTADVCSTIIKPRTASNRISYVELLQRTGKTACTGEAKWFVSHAWACKFLSVVETIFQKCKDEGLDDSACIIWFDIFSVDQHSGIQHFDHWAISFQEAIRRIGKAWIIFIPYFAVWLERAWCLFELYAMVEGGIIPFEILLPPAEQDAFAQYLINGGKVEDAISKIDIREARAYKQSDQDNINRIVAASVGHGKLNELVTTEMRKWFLSSAESELQKMLNDEKLTSELHLNTAKMYITIGRLSDADTELEKRHQKQLALLGAESLKVAETKCELATVKCRLGQLQVALSMLKEARLIYEKSAVENLELLGNITNRIGLVLYDQGKYDDAMQSYMESLAIKTQWFGPHHVGVASTHVNIGNVYQAQGEYERALFHLNTGLPVLISQLGNAHVSVADTKQSIGIVLANLGNSSKSLQLYQEAHSIYMQALGREHPKTKGIAPFIHNWGPAPYVGPAVTLPYGGPALTPPYGRPAVAPPYGLGRPAVALAPPYGRPAVAPPYGGPAVAPPYGGPAVAPPYGRPAVAPPYGGSAVAPPRAYGVQAVAPSYGGQAVSYGVEASTRTASVVLGQDAEGLPGVAGLTHADFRAGEQVAVLRTSGRHTVGRVTAAWPGWVRVEVEQGGASKDVR
eukprot:CAMPEP_0172204986 /NCGR_PEP_ID=MMETSP1050-20130122/32320_1 /TAXON_ID=233186 /ORGANISM="Cryptomonas curvata, Strain CCAP979/52" /LENGTH=627 /DNA_ID=CAMNT_0012883725 /DNA_START=2212 /DNA_END=4091 /DNA_ORIENTATION=-